MRRRMVDSSGLPEIGPKCGHFGATLDHIGCRGASQQNGGTRCWDSSGSLEIGPKCGHFEVERIERSHARVIILTVSNYVHVASADALLDFQRPQIRINEPEELHLCAGIRSALRDAIESH